MQLSYYLVFHTTGIFVQISKRAAQMWCSVALTGTCTLYGKLLGYLNKLEAVEYWYLYGDEYDGEKALDTFTLHLLSHFNSIDVSRKTICSLE